MEKPLLLVDVDGVLFPFGDAVPADFEERTMGNERVPVSPQVAARLRRLCATFEPAWCTARCDDVVPTVARLYGIGNRWPVVHFGCVHRFGSLIQIDGYGVGKTWKLPWLNKWLGDQGWQERPLVWLDDDLHHPDVFEWSQARQEKGIPTLLVPVTPNEGLADEHVQIATGWADSLHRSKVE